MHKILKGIGVVMWILVKPIFIIIEMYCDLCAWRYWRNHESPDRWPEGRVELVGDYWRAVECGKKLGI